MGQAHAATLILAPATNPASQHSMLRDCLTSTGAVAVSATFAAKVRPPCHFNSWGTMFGFINVEYMLCF
jgi:hypothetical protein